MANGRRWCTGRLPAYSVGVSWLLVLLLHARHTAAALVRAPAAPQLSLPAADARTILPTPHFSWLPSCTPRATSASCGGYRIQITHAGSRNILLDAEVSSVLTRFVPVTPLPTGRYLWRVAPLNADGALRPLDQPWSEQRALSIVSPTHEIRVAATATYAEMQVAFAQASASRVPTAVRFAPNMSRTLHPRFNGDIFAALANCSDVLLDFNGAILTFTKYVGFFALDGCERVAIRDLTVDLQPLPYSALRVDSIAPDFLSFSGSVMAGHPPPETLNITTRNGGEIMNPITTRTKRGVIEGVTFVPAFVSSNNRSYKVQLENVSNAMNSRGLNQGLNIGDAFIVGERTGPAGFEVLGGSDVSFIGVTVHACANECFTSAYTSKLSILSTNMILLPGRFKAGNDGGHNHHSARVGAWIENGQWQNTGDDICHVSSLVMSATQQWIDEATGAPMLRLVHSSGDRYIRDHNGGRLVQLRVGDTLQFFNRSSGVLLSEQIVRSVSFDTGSSAGGVTVVALDAYPGSLDLGTIGDIKAVTNIFDLNSTATQFVFRNNSVLNGRRFGVLAKGLRLVIEDNRFVGLGSGAVQYLNSITEGLCARSAVVRRNVVENVMQLASHGRPPLFDPNGAFWTSTMPSQSADSEGTVPGIGIPCHQDLLFSNNTVISGPHPIVQLYATSDVLVEKNHVTRCGSAQQWGAWSFPGADSKITVANDNTVANKTSASLCSKRASLVKSEADHSVYFVDWLFQTGGGITAAPLLHKLGNCHQCGDPHLCQRMGVNEVDADFITSRSLGRPFSCDMLPGPRVLQCSDRLQDTRLFEAQPGGSNVHRIEDCDACGGQLCSVVVSADKEYCATLKLANELFECAFASGDRTAATANNS